MNVPEQVKNEARELIEQYGDSFEYLGNYEGSDVYVFKFPEDPSGIGLILHDICIITHMPAKGNRFLYRQECRAAAAILHGKETDER